MCVLRYIEAALHRTMVILLNVYARTTRTILAREQALAPFLESHPPARGSSLGVALDSYALSHPELYTPEVLRAMRRDRLTQTWAGH